MVYPRIPWPLPPPPPAPRMLKEGVGFVTSLSPEAQEAVRSLRHRQFTQGGWIPPPPGRGPTMGFNPNAITDEMHRLGLTTSGTEYWAMRRRREQEEALAARRARWKAGAWVGALLLLGLVGSVYLGH